MTVTDNERRKRASLYNVMTGIGKDICTKVVLFHPGTIFAVFCAVIIAVLGGRLVVTAEVAECPPPESQLQVFLLEAKQLEISRRAVREGDARFAAAWTRLKSDAQ